MRAICTEGRWDVQKYFLRRLLLRYDFKSKTTIGQAKSGAERGNADKSGNKCMEVTENTV